MMQTHPDGKRRFMCASPKSMPANRCFFCSPIPEDTTRPLIQDTIEQNRRARGLKRLSALPPSRQKVKGW